MAIKQAANTELSCEQLASESKTNTDVAARRLKKAKTPIPGFLARSICTAGADGFTKRGWQRGQRVAGSQHLPSRDREKQGMQGYGQLARTAEALYYDYSNLASSLTSRSL